MTQSEKMKAVWQKPGYRELRAWRMSTRKFPKQEQEKKRRTISEKQKQFLSKRIHELWQNPETRQRYVQATARFRQNYPQKI